MGKTVNLTTKQICAGFRISHVTALNWRKGLGNKGPLPVVDPEAREVRFALAPTKAWAKENGLKFDQAAALATEATATTGPKPTSKAPAAKASHKKPSAATKGKRVAVLA